MSHQNAWATTEQENLGNTLRSASDLNTKISQLISAFETVKEKSKRAHHDNTSVWTVNSMSNNQTEFK